MKTRIVLAAITVVALTVLVLPGATGLMAERQQERILKRLADRLNADVSTERYERGWFRSKARYRFTAHPVDDRPAGDIDQPVITVTSSIRHGPFPPGLDRMAFRPGIARVRSTLELKNAQGERSLPGVVYTRVGFSGGGRAHYVSGPVEETLPTGSVLNWAGGNVTLGFDADGERLKVAGELGKLQVERPNLELAAGPTRLAGELSLSRHGLWTGAIAIQIAELVPQRTESRDLALNGVSISASFDDDDDSGGKRLGAGRDRVSLALRASAASVHSGEWNGGEAVIDFQVGGLAREAFQEFLQGLREHAVSTQSDSWKLDLPAAKDQLGPLFEQGGSVNLKALRIPTRQGNIEASLSVTLEAQTAPLGPDGLWEYSTAELSLQLPRTLADQAAGAPPAAGGMLGNLVQYGLLRPSGDDYQIDASYTDGILTINDASLPFPVQPARTASGTGPATEETAALPAP